MTDREFSPSRFGAEFSAFMQAVLNEAVPPGRLIPTMIAAHLGCDPAQLPVLAEELDPYEHPNLQIAMDVLLANEGRRAELLGVGSELRLYGQLRLSTMVGARAASGPQALVEGPVDYVNFHLANGRILPCVQFGIYLLHDGERRLVVAVIGPSEREPRPKLRVEVMGERPGEVESFLAELRETMQRENIYRGHVISISPGEMHMGSQTLVAFHTLPEVMREDVILPDGRLEQIERQTIVFSQHADELLAAGRSLKRGLLLYGPPGTGKTLTLMYLIGRLPDRTILLVTGQGMGRLRPVIQLARSLAPAMVVLEDVDLIAEDRFRPDAGGPLLFEMLNEMDGLREDCDIIFALTTNLPQVLEPALTARPGRIDLALELPLPDVGGRFRLLQLYAQGLELQDVDLRTIAERSEGASPAFIKELLRKSALLAAIDGTSGGRIAVTQLHLERALGELDEGGQLTHRLLGLQAASGQGVRSHFRPPTGMSGSNPKENR